MEEGESKIKNPMLQFFNLHPLDAFEYSLNVKHQLQQFVEAFKERIEVQIDYSKSLFKISKILQKYIQPEVPTPLSFICSAFKVEHQQRARHALQLAEYLHTEVEVSCQNLLNTHQFESKKLQRQLKKYYKQGQMIEQNYQKHLKKYFKTKQECVLMYTPGVSQSQKDKATLKLSEQKKECDLLYYKYVEGLQIFNQFASRYNQVIGGLMVGLQNEIANQLLVEGDSLRKLIVSQVNMFKNIEYDLLNISKQMEDLQLQTQVDYFVMENKHKFINPIISIYNDGPIFENRYTSIDYKYPMNRTLMEQTLKRIERCQFQWMYQNKNNSTLNYALECIWDKLQGKEEVGKDQDYMVDFQDIVKTNKIVKRVNVDNDQQREEKLRPEEAYSISFQILTNISNFLKENNQNQQKIQEKIELMRSYFALHHFYRFIGLQFLQQYQNMHDNKIANIAIAKNYILMIRVIIEESIKAKDIFIIRGFIALLFGTSWVQNEKENYLYKYPDIAKLEIWESNDFWEAAVFEATYQQISLLPIVDRVELKEVFMMRQKNVVFSGLVTYCHYMIMLGMQQKEVRYVLSRFCQIFNLYEQHERDLVKTIANSLKQYKQNQAVE